MTGEGVGEEGAVAKTCAGEKAWYSVIHLIFSEFLLKTIIVVSIFFGNICQLWQCNVKILLWVAAFLPGI
jgi:hypothetical protein